MSDPTLAPLTFAAAYALIQERAETKGDGQCRYCGVTAHTRRLEWQYTDKFGFEPDTLIDECQFHHAATCPVAILGRVQEAPL